MAIVVAAFGLFCVELLAARLLLPVFGGAAAVWTTTLCFFTAILFLGYLYAHLVATRLSSRAGGFIHLALAIAAIALTVAAPAGVATLRRPGLAPALNVLIALAVLVGPASFVMGSTTPLLSAWQSRDREPPWWLYAASNAASFAALLAYPFAIAPALPLSRQRLLLPILLIAYGGALAWILVRGRGERGAASIGAPDRRGATAATAVREAANVAPAAADTPPLRRQLIWLLAAAAPAGLLSATTNFIQTDLVAAPLLWIGPLAAYLASFVVAFSERGRRALPIVERLVPAAATLLWLPFVGKNWPVLPMLGVVLASLLVLCVAVHGRLAGDRPAGPHLTRFYLLISLGGMIATAFVALVAPLVFSRIYEYPVLIAASVAALVLLPGPNLRPGVRIFEAPGRAVVALAATAPLDALLTPIVLASVVAANRAPALVRERTFFGVTEVVETRSTRQELSGTTLHGLQATDERRTEPTTYYSRVGPLGMIFDDVRSRGAAASIGVVGLGVGTIAAYTRPGDRITFFEIDGAVIDIARNPSYFTYLSDAPIEPRVVVGDGRLSLAAEPDRSFDLLVLDAFTSDVVPAHLLTREAMQGYARTLRPGGLLAFHLSSHFYDLPFSVGATARSLGWSVAVAQITPSQADMERLAATPSTWLVAGGVDDVARFTARRWIPLRDQGTVLTDDYSDLTRLLIVSRAR